MNISTLKPFIPLILIVFISVFSLKFGFGKAIEVNEKIAQLQKSETILNQKLNILKSAEATAGDDSTTTFEVLPDKNPSLATVSQLKAEASALGLGIYKIKSIAPADDKSEISKVGLNFEVEGEKSLVLQFLNGIPLSAPLTEIDKFKLVDTGAGVRAQVTTTSFFAALPKKLPQLGDPINDLTNDERTVLSELSGFKKPFVINLSPTEEQVRSDPFSL